MAPGYVLFLSAGREAVLALSSTTNATRAPLDPRGRVSESNPRRAARRLTLVGADLTARAEGRETLPGTVNYLPAGQRSDPVARRDRDVCAGGL